MFFSIQTFSKMMMFHFGFYSKLKGKLEVFQINVISFRSCSDSNLKVQNHFEDNKLNILEMAFQSLHIYYIFREYIYPLLILVWFVIKMLY